MSARVWGEATSPWEAALLGLVGTGGMFIAALLARPIANPPSTMRTMAALVAPPAPPLVVASAATTSEATAAACPPIVVPFEFGSAALDPGSAQSLDDLGHWLLDRPGARVLVHGHADAFGKEDTNLALSRARALAVSSRIAMTGVSRSHITTRGFGAYQPVEGAPEEAASNRRVVVYVKGTSTCRGRNP